jgi:hypothetical protein
LIAAPVADRLFVASARLSLPSPFLSTHHDARCVNIRPLCPVSVQTLFDRLPEDDRDVKAPKAKKRGSRTPNNQGRSGTAVPLYRRPVYSGASLVRETADCAQRSALLRATSGVTRLQRPPDGPSPSPLLRLSHSNLESLASNSSHRHTRSVRCRRAQPWMIAFLI